jgi:hypothetical protein
MTCTIQGQEMNETDAYGMTLVEGIYRGQNWRARLRGLEWKSGLLAILQTFGQATPGTLSPFLQQIGQRMTNFSQVFLLTAILGNPPTTPQTLTSLSSFIAPQQASEFNMTSKIRELPLEMCLVPYSAVVGSLTLNVPFTVT